MKVHSIMHFVSLNFQFGNKFLFMQFAINVNNLAAKIMGKARKYRMKIIYI